MTPVDALWKAIVAAHVSSKALKPGVVIAALPSDVRDALMRLTSDEARNMRMEP